MSPMYHLAYGKAMNSYIRFSPQVKTATRQVTVVNITHKQREELGNNSFLIELYVKCFN